MTPEQAYLALAPLVAGTSGWNEDVVRFYSSELTGLSDPALLASACHDVLWSWKLGRRPAIADILECYNNRLTKVLVEAEQCTHCDGTGWVEALDFHAPYCRQPDTCNCHAVDWCPECRDGDPGPAGIRPPQLAAPMVPLTEYLDRLAVRAKGNREAAEELAIWTKHRKSPYVRALEVEA